jgi:hypothetical protein
LATLYLATLYLATLYLSVLNQKRCKNVHFGKPRPFLFFWGGGIYYKEKNMVHGNTNPKMKHRKFTADWSGDFWGFFHSKSILIIYGKENYSSFNMIVTGSRNSKIIL